MNSSNILPFGYQHSDVVNIAGKESFYSLLNKYGEIKDIEITDKILSINHKYPPTWGVKIDKKGIIEFEMYFYVYNPSTRIYEDDAITVNKLQQKFNFECQYKSVITMYSMDYHIEPIELNFYYFTSSNEILDIGYSEKNKQLTNHYYRFFPDTIDNNYIDYIDTNLINYHIIDIKTIFVADKLVRNFYGIYYDGVDYTQLKYFLEKYNFDKNLIIGFDKNRHYSISIDFNKIDNSIERIGIYGLLYE